jgi:hypothetical protein
VVQRRPATWNKGLQRDRAERVTPVERQFPDVAAAVDQPVMPGLPAPQADQRPVVVMVAMAPWPGEYRCHAAGGRASTAGTCSS